MSSSSGKQPEHMPGEEPEFHRLLRKSAEPGILVFTRDGKVVSVSSSAALLLQIRPESVKTLDDLPTQLAAILWDSIGTSEEQLERRVSLVPDSEGEGRSVIWVNTFRVPFAGSELGLFLASIHDLGVARELEAKTVRLQQLGAVGLLSASVAHEVKNALVAVKTYVELVMETQPDLEAAALVRREVGRIDSLIAQLLKLSTPRQASPAPVRVHAVLADAIRLVQHQLRERGIKECVLLEARTDLILGHAAQLEQAILNLLFNAIDAMPNGGQLVLRTELVVATEHISKIEPGRREEQLQIEIKDSGTGVAPEVLERLFTPFLTTKPSGTGLGLTITRRIVTAHHGRILVESKTNSGTSFKILLPLHKESPPAETTPNGN
jgi:signal transduction histidine kinase